MPKKIKYGFNKENVKAKLKSSRLRKRDQRNPVRALSRIVDDEYEMSDSGVYDEVHLGGKVYDLKNKKVEGLTQQYKPQKDKDVGPPKIKKAMGGVMKNRGGTFKGTY